MIKRFVTIFFILIAFPCFSREIIIGVINDGPHHYSLHYNHSIKRQKSYVIKIIKSDLKRKFKHDILTFKYIDYDDSNFFAAAKAIKKQITSIRPHIIFGPYSYKVLHYLKDTIRNSKIPFVSQISYSSLRNLKNFYTPFEWNDVALKLNINKAKELMDKKKPKIGAFVQINDDLSVDAYESAKRYLKNDLFVIKLVHSQSKKYWQYEYKLDDDIKNMIKYSPDIILNPNSQDINQISFDLSLKMTNQGFNGIFIDSESWPCSRYLIETYKEKFSKTKAQSIGISAAQLKCPQDWEQDEKKFRMEILQNEEQYYPSSGLFYKTLKHVLNSILESHLPISSSNIQKIIQKNSFFKGFSNEKFNLYKTKDSPEFLNIYKYYFEKNFRIENLTSLNLYQKQDSNKESSDK